MDATVRCVLDTVQLLNCCGLQSWPPKSGRGRPTGRSRAASVTISSRLVCAPSFAIRVLNWGPNCQQQPFRQTPASKKAVINCPNRPNEWAQNGVVFGAHSAKGHTQLFAVWCECVYVIFPFLLWLVVFNFRYTSNRPVHLLRALQLSFCLTAVRVLVKCTNLGAYLYFVAQTALIIIYPGLQKGAQFSFVLNCNTFPSKMFFEHVPFRFRSQAEISICQLLLLLLEQFREALAPTEFFRL